MPVSIVPQRPEPDAESIAETVRERYQTLARRNPLTLAEMDEIVRLQRLLTAHVVYIQETRHA